jgi:hypothetical protein
MIKNYKKIRILFKGPPIWLSPKLFSCIRLLTAPDPNKHKDPYSVQLSKKVIKSLTFYSMVRLYRCGVHFSYKISSSLEALGDLSRNWDS